MFKTLLIVLSLIALMVSPVMALAQGDDEMELVEFESESGLLKITYPAEWFVADSSDPEVDPSTISFANNEDLLERILADNETDEGVVAVPGDRGGFVVSLPVAVLAFFGVPVSDETTPEEVAGALAEVFFSEDEDAVAEFGEPDTIELEDQPAVGIVPFTEEKENIEGVIYVYLKDELVVTGFIAAAMGEFDEEYRDIAIDMILTYEISLTADELLAIMMGQE